MRRRRDAREEHERAALQRRLQAAEQKVTELKAELDRLNSQALQVARQFEQEAAARAEAEAIATALNAELGKLSAQLAEQSETPEEE